MVNNITNVTLPDVGKVLFEGTNYYVKGTQTASTNVWLGNLPEGVENYYDGLSIMYFLPYAGTSTAATLNLSGKGAKPVIHGRNASVTTHYVANSIIHLTYIVSPNINSGNGAWVGSAYYDSNSDTKVTQTATTTNASYEVLFSQTADNTTRTEEARKNNNLLFNPSTGNLQATQLNGVTIGTSPKFTDTNYYHKTGTWSGLTYTAGKVGSPDDLAFTIPTGTTASTVAVGNHTHSYAGSSAAGGSANSAVKLDSNAGSATNPIYFSGGKPATCTYSLNKTVPSDAVFTDTNKYHKSGSWSGLKYTATAVNSAEELSFTIPTGTSGTTVAAGNHTHTTTIASSTGTNQITLAHGGKYAITAGGASYVFTMPASGNTDEKVKQTDTSSNKDYRIILSNDAVDTQQDAQVYKSSKLEFNPVAKFNALKINAHLLGGNSNVGGYDVTGEPDDNGSIAFGDNCYAGGSYNTAVGVYCSSGSLNGGAHAEGYYSSALVSPTGEGKSCHAEGNYSMATGDGSHAEGGRASNEGNLASGAASHAEGLTTTASGNASHAEGGWNLSSGSCSHTDGYGNTASAENSHAEGRLCIVTGKYSHAEGWYTSCIGKASHSEGYQTCAYGPNESDADAAHAEGYQSSASGRGAHAEGRYSRATSTGSHAEGNTTRATGTYSHAEGDRTTASGEMSHAEGRQCKATASYAHGEGYQSLASGTYSHAEGYETTSNANYSHTSGAFTSANNPASTALGHWNVKMTTGGAVENQTGTAFVIGNGTSKDTRSNAFSVQFDGTVKAANTITANATADYAEMFEWYDENPNDEDRVGYFITFEDGNKIRIVNNENDYILGISSGDPFVLGNGDCDYWTKLELRDDFNRVIYEPAQKMEVDEETGEFIPVYDEEGNPVYEGTRPKYNPDYDPTKPYISRLDRKEWQAVGMLGVLRVRQDGTLVKNGYCTIDYSTGKATFIDHYNKNDYIYRVIDVINDDVAEVVFK